LPFPALPLAALSQPTFAVLFASKINVKKKLRNSEVLQVNLVAEMSHRRDKMRTGQATFCGVFRSRTSRSNRSRSAVLIEICSIFLIGADSQVRADL
jgi:hypothetical protein